MNLRVLNGDTINLKTIDSNQFDIEAVEDGDSITICASEILILTPKSLKWYKLFKFLVGILTHTKLVDYYPSEVVK
jgi:hypothetical protein